MANQKVYKFESADKQIFQMTSEDIDQSVFLSKVVAAWEKNPSIPDVIQIRKMPGDIMKMVVKWCQMHRIDAQTTSTWPEDYLRSLNEKQFNNFMWAAEHLVIHSVLLVMKKEMLRRMKARRPAEFDRIFELDKLGMEARKEDDKFVVTIRRRM